ncbi:hypothetical protein GCM10022263_32940 [Nocardioides daeguensis]|uniref:Cytochrome bc1 complex Rieske iron-sulfur subunit n=1 Tax=Nocardioides daeguensis TaxID=908359 RepID=A0ABP6W2K9_9ACTN
MSRRRALVGVATLGVGAPLLAACGDDASSATDPVPSDPTGALTTAAPSPPTTGSAATDPAATDPAATATASGLVAAADVAVGGGVVLPAQEIVVTQPAAGVFKAFSALCTHQGCLVGTVADGAIQCACHGSSFSAADGSVQVGPASSPLAAVAVRVVEGQVRRA